MISLKLVLPLMGIALSQSAALCVAAPAPLLSSNPPAYIQAGQSRDLSFAAQNLAQVSSVALPSPRGLQVDVLKQPDVNQVKLHLVAAPDAEPGDRELRVVSPSGVSNAIVISVGAYPLIEEKEPNNAAGEAQVVSLPAVITGRIAQGGDVDQYQFHATRGQEILFNASVARIGSPLEPVLVIHDGTGRELPVVTEMHEDDPLIVFAPPADGDYRLEIRDLRFRGGSDFGYRIEAGAVPYLETVFPMSAPAGKAVELKAVGHNLADGETISLDLTHAQPGRIMVRSKTPVGLSNPLPFEVTSGDAPPESPAPAPALSAASANPIAIPAEIAGCLDRAGSENFFKFHLAQKQKLDIEVLAHRIGSPVDALLTLRNSAGAAIDVNNGAAGAESHITRELDPGDYLVSVRDLTWAGGENYSYRLKICPAGASGAQADFAVRFLPDVLRLHRGGSVPLWCEVDRSRGFTGEVSLTLEGLPPGMSSPPAQIGASSSGYFTISAAPDAALGSFPIRLKANATVNGQSVTRDAQPEAGGREMQQAYVTVLEPAPFTVEPLVLTPQRIQSLHDEIAALTAKLNAPDPALDSAEANWASKIATGASWTTLDASAISAASGTTLTELPDGSVLASGAIPQKETYTLVAKTPLKAITAIRLEALSHPSLPAQGPGAAPNGNFVLTNFKVLSQHGNDPQQPVILKDAVADFSQAGFPIANAIDSDPKSGWAISGEFGKNHVATFLTASPLGAGDETTLTFVLENQSGFAQHNLGRFRISVSTADPAALPSEAVPASILAIAKLPGEQRTAEQKSQLTSYFRTIDPRSAPERSRLESLQKFLAAAPTTQPVSSFASARNRATTLPMAIDRASAFAGEVEIKLIGFSSGRDPATHLPVAVAKNLKVAPLKVPAGQALASLSITPEGNCELGTRKVVLVAETQVGNETITQYSQAFDLTVNEK